MKAKDAILGGRRYSARAAREKAVLRDRFLFRGKAVRPSNGSARGEDETHRVRFVAAPSDSSGERRPREKREPESAFGPVRAHDFRDQLDLAELLRKAFPRRRPSEVPRRRHR